MPEQPLKLNEELVNTAKERSLDENKDNQIESQELEPKYILNLLCEYVNRNGITDVSALNEIKVLDRKGLLGYPGKIEKNKQLKISDGEKELDIEELIFRPRSDNSSGAFTLAKKQHIVFINFETKQGTEELQKIRIKYFYYLCKKLGEQTNNWNISVQDEPSGKAERRRKLKIFFGNGITGTSDEDLKKWIELFDEVYNFLVKTRPSPDELNTISTPDYTPNWKICGPLEDAFTKNMKTDNDLWWFSFDKIADKVEYIKQEGPKPNNELSINGKIKIFRAKYNGIFLGCQEKGKTYDICADASTIKAGLATAFSMKYNADDKFRQVFQYNEKTHNENFVMEQGGIIPIKTGLPLHLFFDSIKEVFDAFSNEDSGQLIIIFQCLKKDSIDYMKKMIGEKNIHPYHVPHNRIIFGAPGTGKSWKLKEESAIFGSYVTRVTFHPDYSYFDFVGSYKPVMRNVPITYVKDGELEKAQVEGKDATERKIQYDFIPGPFSSTLRESLRHPVIDYCLIIEEINRARVAAVFGDIFQLLDRDNSGNSEYRIKPSKELARYLATTDDDKGTIDENKLREYESNGIYLPSNLYIWATMNSADQGVYPLDTAFKRRWSMEYLSINEGAENDRIGWNTIRKGINDLLKPHVNEDKLMGYHFLKEEERDTEAHLEEALKGKVLMYLFDDAAKPCRKDVFIEINGSRIYSDLCTGLSLQKKNLGIFTGFHFWPGQQEQRAGGNEQNETNTEEAEPDVEQQ